MKNEFENKLPQIISIEIISTFNETGQSLVIRDMPVFCSYKAVSIITWSFLYKIWTIDT